MKSNLSCYDNSWYNPGGSYIKRILWYFINTLFFINPMNPFSFIKVVLLRLFGAKVGAHVVIKPSLNILGIYLLVITHGLVKAFGLII